MSSSLWDLFVCTYARGYSRIVAETYRQIHDFPVELIKPAMSWFERQNRRKGCVLRFQCSARKLEGGGIGDHRVTNVYEHISVELSTQNYYSTRPSCITYRVSSAFVFMRIFSRIRAR